MQLLLLLLQQLCLFEIAWNEAKEKFLLFNTFQGRQTQNLLQKMIKVDKLAERNFHNFMSQFIIALVLRDKSYLYFFSRTRKRVYK